VSLFIFSVESFRQRFYEIFAKSHFVLAILLIGASWMHVRQRKLFKPPMVYLLISACLFGVRELWGAIRFVERNMGISQRANKATVFRIPQSTEAMLLHLTVSRPWKFRGGQYIYVCIPATNWTSFCQYHPFFIMGWSSNHNTVELLVQHRHGFTGKSIFYSERLDSSSTERGQSYQLRPTNPASNPQIQSRPSPMESSGIDFNMKRLVEGPCLTAFIEGPYEQQLDLESYGTVILVATGVGVAPQLSWIQQLLYGIQNSVVKTRKISLLWEIEAEGLWRTKQNVHICLPRVQRINTGLETGLMISSV
jgi:predicted ferric reductase